MITATILMSWPQPPHNPCPKNNPHCQGTTQPPNPGNSHSATVSIDQVGFIVGIGLGYVMAYLTIKYFTRKNGKTN